MTPPAQTNLESANALAKLLPPYGELPAGFWEQHGATVVIVSLVALVLLALIVWRLLRVKPPVILSPEVQARTALAALRQRPDDGARLSNISQIVRRYFLAAFQLPSGELTTAEFSRVIAGHAQIGSELAEAVSSFLRCCDEQKFSSAGVAATFPTVDQALELVAAAETRRRSPPPASVA